MSKERLDKGTEVDIYIRGTIESRIHTQNGDTYGVRVGSDQQWGLTLLPGMAKIKRATPPHLTLEPGQIWQADGIRWMAQLRRPDLPLRLTPQDMSDSSELKTLSEDEFFRTYPYADLVLHAKRPAVNAIIMSKPETAKDATSALTSLREHLEASLESKNGSQE